LSRFEGAVVIPLRWSLNPLCREVPAFVEGCALLLGIRKGQGAEEWTQEELGRQAGVSAAVVTPNVPDPTESPRLEDGP
jgi:hypothetical protein